MNNSAFDDGDWNGDGELDSSDLVFSLQSGTYINAVAVESRSNMMLIAAAISAPTTSSSIPTGSFKDRTTMKAPSKNRIYLVPQRALLLFEENQTSDIGVLSKSNGWIVWISIARYGALQAALFQFSDETLTVEWDLRLPNANRNPDPTSGDQTRVDSLSRPTLAKNLRPTAHPLLLSVFRA